MTTVCVMCGKIIHGASHPAACGVCASRIVPLVPNHTIKLRIRVGVTADGQWVASGEHGGDVARGADELVMHRLRNAGDVVAWHWITAKVPMPEVEQGEVAGEVES